jgi:hypothetical protein
VGKESFDLPPVLAEPPRHSRRHRIIVAVAAHLAVILGTAGAVALIQGSGADHPSVGLAATLTSPGDGEGTVAAFSPDGKTLASVPGRRWPRHLRVPPRNLRLTEPEEIPQLGTSHCWAVSPLHDQT